MEKGEGLDVQSVTAMPTSPICYNKRSGNNRGEKVHRKDDQVSGPLHDRGAPGPKDKKATSKESNSSTVDLASIPNMRLHSVMRETSETAGMVNPMLA